MHKPTIFRGKFLSLFLMIPVALFSQFYNTEVEASISINVQDEHILQISGTAYNKTALNKSLRFVLSVIHKNSNNDIKTKNDQEGRFVLESGMKKSLSTVSTNINSDDRTIILLLVYNEKDIIVGKDRKVLNGVKGEQDEVTDALGKEINSKAEDVKVGNDDGFILRGMVVRNTKTKAGNDFYDMFYSQYLAKNINGEKIVNIVEELALGTNTRMKIYVDKTLVVQFFINPRTQFLKKMAEQSIYRVNAHFQQLRNTKNQIIKY